MFNDFKFLSFNSVTHKIRRLKDIFDRLNLSKLEERYNRLLNSLDLLDVKVEEFKKWYQETVTEPPVTPPVIPPTEELLPDLIITSIIPTEFDNYINFQITVKNIGDKIASASNLSVSIPDLFNTSVLVPLLGINETFITNAQYSYDPLGDEEGVIAYVTINPSHSVLEKTYANNSSSISCIVHKKYEPVGKAFVIVHAHNPEGKEIGAIGAYDTDQRYGQIGASYNIDGYEVFGHTPIVPSEHGQLIEVPLGPQSCVITFNGMTHDFGIIDFQEGMVVELVATFDRINAEFDFTRSASDTVSINYNEYPHIKTVGSATIYKYYNLSGTATTNIVLSKISSSASITTSLTYIPPFTYGHIVGSGGLPQSQWLSDINILPQTTFSLWYVQACRIGTYPQIRAVVESGEGIGEYDMVLNRLGDIAPISAHYHYTKIKTGGPGVSNQILATEGLISKTTTNVGSINVGFYVSSVPYDVANIAF